MLESSFPMPFSFDSSTGIRNLIIFLVLVVAGVGAVPIAGIRPCRNCGVAVLGLEIGYVIGLFMFFVGLTAYRRRSVIRNTPTSSVRSMALGDVEIAGTANPAKGVLESPYAGEECLVYTYEVELFVTSQRRRMWETVDKGVEVAPFYVDDGTGRVLVNPEGAVLELQEGNVYRRASNEEPTPANADSFKETLGDMKVWITGSPEWRYTETYLRPGEEVYVFGEAVERGEGVSSQSEDNIVIAEGDAPLFMISDSSEKELLSSMRWATWGLMGGGIIIALGCVVGLSFFLWPV